MTDALDQLKQRLAEIVDLGSIARLLSWDQQTIMPPAGAGIRAEQRATLGRLAHEQFVSDETARLLDAVRPLEESLDPDSDDAGRIRVVRRDFAKARRVPADLRAEMARSAAQAFPVWSDAKARSDFAAFLPVLEHNIELRMRYVECFDPVDEPYDILLDDYEPETSTAAVREVFEQIKASLVPAVRSLADGDTDDDFLTGDYPVERQVQLVNEVVDLLGMRPATWRLDPTEHPFASGAGIDDVRITTHYDPHGLDAFFSTVHEYGHGLYNHQLPRHLARLPVGASCSLGIHESQSRMWENLVGRALPFWQFFYPRVQQLFPEQLADVELERFLPAINRPRRSLIRIHADELTYGLHVILRFELEQDIVNGRVAVRDLPEAWNAKIAEYLGLEVPDDAHGVLQDVHWSGGMVGYFPTYLLGTVMSVQIWQRVLADVPDLEDEIARGEFGPLREWLAEHVHGLGRKFPPQETLRRAVGSTIDAKPYLAYLDAKYGLGVAA
jgi:carboxypeptidase Taq